MNQPEKQLICWCGHEESLHVALHIGGSKACCRVACNCMGFSLPEVPVKPESRLLSDYDLRTIAWGEPIPEVDGTLAIETLRRVAEKEHDLTASSYQGMIRQLRSVEPTGKPDTSRLLTDKELHEVDSKLGKDYYDAEDAEAWLIDRRSIAKAQRDLTTSIMDVEHKLDIHALIVQIQNLERVHNTEIANLKRAGMQRVVT